MALYGAVLSFETLNKASQFSTVKGIEEWKPTSIPSDESHYKSDSRTVTTGTVLQCSDSLQSLLWLQNLLNQLSVGSRGDSSKCNNQTSPSLHVNISFLNG